MVMRSQCLAVALLCAVACRAGAESATAPAAGAALEPAPAELRARLRGHVDHLAGRIGGRGLDRQGSLDDAAAYLRAQWSAQGHIVKAQAYEVGGATVENLAVVIPGREPELVVVGAHYDTCLGNPGADDNASGVAALLELTRALVGVELRRTIHFVAFVNEEPPYFQDPGAMGSSVYARQLREQGHEVASMLSLESLGYFDPRPDSQHYPRIVAPLYPNTGDFIGVVGKNGSRPLVRAVVAGLERHGPVPVESIAAPATITGIDWSDHWSFWEQGWPRAVMITDTAIYRNPNYHQVSDRPETLDYERFAWVVVALEGTIRELAGGG